MTILLLKFDRSASHNPQAQPVGKPQSTDPTGRQVTIHRPNRSASHNPEARLARKSQSTGPTGPQVTIHRPNRSASHNLQTQLVRKPQSIGPTGPQVTIHRPNRSASDNAQAQLARKSQSTGPTGPQVTIQRLCRSTNPSRSPTAPSHPIHEIQTDLSMSLLVTHPASLGPAGPRPRGLRCWLAPVHSLRCSRVPPSLLLSLSSMPIHS